MPSASASTSQAGAPANNADKAGAPAAKPAPTPEELTPAELKKQLHAAKVELQASMTRKRAIDKNLATIEHTIYQFESSYLSAPQDGAPVGNVVRGYENYNKALTSTNLGPYDRKRSRLGMDVRDDERLFSRSSETYIRSLELKDKDLSATSDEDQPPKKRKR